MESRRDSRNQIGRSENAGEHYYGDCESEQSEYRIGDVVCFFFIVVCQKLCINWNERPKMFCRKLGMRYAALNASPAADVPK